MLKSRLPQIAIEIEVLLDEAIEKGAEVVKRDAKVRVPVATGKLRNAIHVDPEDDGVYVIGGNDDAWYGHLVEHGTTRTPPRPFLVPALEENRDTVVGIARAALRSL